MISRVIYLGFKYDINYFASTPWNFHSQERQLHWPDAPRYHQLYYPTVSQTECSNAKSQHQLLLRCQYHLSYAPHTTCQHKSRLEHVSEDPTGWRRNRLGETRTSMSIRWHPLFNPQGRPNLTNVPCGFSQSLRANAGTVHIPETSCPRSPIVFL